MSVAKTNAARALDTLRVHYELRAYEVDLDDLSATTVALKVDMPAASAELADIVRR